MSKPTLDDLTTLNLHRLKQNLKTLMDPQVLEQLAQLLEALGTGQDSLLDRYEWFARTAEQGPDCRYAQLAREFFEKDHAGMAAEAIKHLYHIWAHDYQGPEEKK